MKQWLNWKRFQRIHKNFITISVKSSAQTIRIRSVVRGLFSVKFSGNPLSFLTEAIASLIAKNTELPRNTPASPMP